MKNSGPRVGILGAGIAGVTLALMLADSGVPSVLFEQAELSGEIGAGVQLAPSAVRLLHRLGLADALREIAVEVESALMCQWDDGTVVARTPFGKDCADRYGAPYYTVHRADLHALLTSRLETPVATGRRCVEVTEDDESVRLLFADGSTEEVGLLIGADGIRSVVRSRISADVPCFSGELIYRGLVDARRLPGAFGNSIRVWKGTDGHAVMYPVRRGQLISVAATVPAEEGGHESWSRRGDLTAMRARYDCWHDSVRSVLAALDEVTVWALHDREPIECWATDRTVLIGDAAHPMLPFLAQGANQAIEDATVLALCLADAADSHRAAFDRYQRLRVPRAREILLSSRQNAEHLRAEEPASRQDAAVTELPLEDHDWLFGHHAEEV
ncbi:2-polyprenyl-6-methoxyphenol hydroxylase-like oxidoreductase [Frankia casuarinae]|uniref:Salicylate 1-monooxygenase n=2 Tax=Frankia casuarinae (strain DSM 45818 / CECT 9043 / HFP020203 / CcI3) TaxID=106370 RepID=Q2JBA1_FRACC|nr:MULTISPECIES: FAD-dependent monooxygenase [Frankia]ABD11441.1 Salicylate 1-monooxygenase [Frankia casuarinae]ETA00356.1 2-polyprenyl-6-methoxyphenol hydroxylase-like oxidoreductase [Frankia sp. CcI6]EYT89891.1 2-polyprenyl-6-methoxyphenol hydroxylase-like oxidoreductase [Frankia casuarinae]KDA40652.1 2-polyprenyl-6-methoxyphenol hydroxylase-like oxidoreductase [Frankia sp. BMG5.23]KFB02717.1 2-polyprenyl-6-methoxyphenol hydroxylase-like oxidoreductase [Frankia sp. Allo2]